MPHQPTTFATSEEWREFLADVLPIQGCWSEDECLVLTDHRSRLSEFTDGFLEALPTPSDKHQSVLRFVFLALVRFIQPRGGKVQFAPLRLRIRPGKFRQPVLVLLLSAAHPRRQDRYWPGAELAFEVVSEEKTERDLVQKRSEYTEGQIPENWIVDPRAGTFTVLHLERDAYVEAGTYHRGEQAASVLMPGFLLPVSKVFDATQAAALVF